MDLRWLSLGAGLVSILLTYWKKKQHEEKLIKLEQSTTETTWYKFIFITQENFECIEHLRQEVSCGDKCSNNYLQTIKEHLRSAKVSISLCIYHVTLDSIFEELADAHSRNIIVRIITDREMNHHSASITEMLNELGIPVKIQPDTQSFMHHKFFLIDENTDDEEVWFGSLNLTAQALTSNWESVIYTNDTVMISNFSKCFEMLWASFVNL